MVKHNKHRWYGLFLSVMVSPSILAGVNSDLNGFFKSLGYSSNATKGHAYEGQQAGYYTGGSLYARDQVRDYQLMSVTLPSVRAGCGGIDITTGGFSYLGAGLKDAFSNIVNNAVSYSFLLGVETVTPQIANQMKALQNFANTVNMGNIQSCETAAAAVGAVWPKTEVAEDQVCSTLSASTNFTADYTNARMKCGTQRTQTLNQFKNDPKYKNFVFQNTNIAWEAIRQNSFLASDTELSELFLSLSGSIIIKSGSRDEDTNQFVPLMSMADNPSLIKALLYGGTTDVYHCDESTHCLNPTKSKLTIDANSGLASHLEIELNDMYNKILTDTPITAEEKGLLNITQFPIYKILSVQAAYTNGNQLFNLKSLADVVATDLLQQYLNENFNIIEASSNRLQYPSDVLAQFHTSMTLARGKASALYREKMQDVDLNIKMVQQTQFLEQQLAGQLSSRLVNNLRWSQGL